MTSATQAQPDDGGFSPLENETVTRGLRRLHLAGDGNTGSVRRAVLLALVCWLPIFVWALVTGGVSDSDNAEGLLRHYAVHVRCLVFVPLMLLAQPTVHRLWIRLMGRFQTMLVEPEARQRYAQVVTDMRRQANALSPWVIMLALAMLLTFTWAPDLGKDSLAWAVDSSGTMGFGGYWYEYFVHPLSALLLLAWLWRILLMTLLCWRVSRVGMSLVPTHPDRVGGLGLMEDLAGAMGPVTLACASMLSARWAHEIFWHGAAITSFRTDAITFAVVWTLLLLLPQLMFTSLLARVRRRGVGEYSTFVAEFGRKLHERWIEGRKFPTPEMYEAGELGPYADIATLFDGMRSMRPILVGQRSLKFCLVPILLPFSVLAALQAEIPAVLKQLIKLLA